MNNTRKGKSGSRVMLTVFFAVLGFTALCVATVAVLWLSGQSAVNTVRAPELAPATAAPAAQGEPVPTPAPTAVSDDGGYTLTYDGKRYRYNDETINILLMGVDEFEIGEDERGGGAQADVIVLAVLDTKNHKLTFISISRDAMCEYDLLDETGESYGMARGQLALSFTEGDGQALSCENCAAAVSRIFGNLELHGYGALYMDGVEPLNDAVGGVTLNILEELDYGYRAMKYGEDVTLTGEMASVYIQARQHTLEGNNLRMQRQKQYMLALFNQAKAAVKNDPTKVVGIYSSVEKYVLTDLALNKLCYLAFEALGMEFSQDIRNVPGESVPDGEFAAYNIDANGLFSLMLDVFYERVD